MGFYALALTRGLPTCVCACLNTALEYEQAALTLKANADLSRHAPRRETSGVGPNPRPLGRQMVSGKVVFDIVDEPALRSALDSHPSDP